MTTQPIKSGVASGDQLPDELWVQVLAFLGHADLGRALCTNKAFHSISHEAWRAASYRKWPTWAAIAEEQNTNWRRVYELLELREAEKAAIPNLNAIAKRQNLINARRRAILTGWMCEVSFEWNLDSIVVFEAVKYLDCFLMNTEVENLGHFQLVGLGCLRSAMLHYPKPPSRTAAHEELLEASRFADISAHTYSPEQVESMTQFISTTISPQDLEYPNPKMHLRSFWFQATNAGIATNDEMHIYTLASFLLHLSLLDLELSVLPPSQVAAGALSLAFTTFDKPAWPPALVTHGSYVFADLEPVREKLAVAQCEQTARELRAFWSRKFAPNEVEDFKIEWQKTLAMFANASQALQSVIGDKQINSDDDTNSSDISEHSTVVDVDVVLSALAPSPNDLDD